MLVKIRIRREGPTTSESDTGVSRSAIGLMSASATQAERRVIPSPAPILSLIFARLFLYSNVRVHRAYRQSWVHRQSWGRVIPSFALIKTKKAPFMEAF